MNAESCESHDDLVNEAIAEYLEAVETGGAPEPRELVSRHPDLAAELEAFPPSPRLWRTGLPAITNGAFKRIMIADKYGHQRLTALKTTSLSSSASAWAIVSR